MAAKPKARALATFVVRHGTLCLKVRVLPSIQAVHREYALHHEDGAALSRNGKNVEAFFFPTKHPAATYDGNIVLPLNGSRLPELIPHEVSHAVLHKMRTVETHDDEAFATAVGILSARIDRKLRSRWFFI